MTRMLGDSIGLLRELARSYQDEALRGDAIAEVRGDEAAATGAGLVSYEHMYASGGGS